MDEEARALIAEERQLLDEELELLARIQTSLEAARAAQARAPDSARLRPDALAELRALRSEAASASEDDLPGLLHELSVRQTLLERGPRDTLPSPDSPYVAHLRLLEGGLHKDYFLGQSSHLDAARGVRIVDWRVAPVARIFYGYREGDEYEEEFPGRVAEGLLEARRIVVIEGGELRQVVTDRYVLTRAGTGQWQSQTRASYAISTGGTGSAVRPEALLGSVSKPAPSVTALLDAEQFSAIAAPAEQPLLVLGSAGSGKTTVALHRLARIAALAPEQYALDRMQVIVPEEGLARLSRRLLAPLGVAEARVQTLHDWALALAQRVFGARLPRLCSETPALVSSLKRHPALYAALYARFGQKKSGPPTSFKRLRRLLAELMSDRQFLSGVVESARGTLSRAAVEATVRHTMLQLADSVDQQLAAVVDRARLRTVDGRAIAEDTPEALARTIDSEDLPIFLAILAWRQQLELEPATHLVLDEAEDFSLFEFHVLGRLQGARKSFTLAGDEAQQTSSSFAGFDAALAELGTRDAQVCRLSVSYRCPRPIFELAQQILGELAARESKSAARDGAAVGHFAFPSDELAMLFSVGEVVDLAAREPDASIAVVAHDADAARRFHALLPEHAQARLVLSGEFSFEAGIDVTDLDSVKGLEFDYVLVPQVNDSAYPSNDEARRRLHVAVTRAIWQLWLVSGGIRSKILPPLDA